MQALPVRVSISPKSSRSAKSSRVPPGSPRTAPVLAALTIEWVAKLRQKHHSPQRLLSTRSIAVFYLTSVISFSLIEYGPLLPSALPWKYLEDGEALVSSSQCHCTAWAEQFAQDSRDVRMNITIAGIPTEATWKSSLCYKKCGGTMCQSVQLQR